MSLSSGEQVIYSTRLSKRIFVKPFVVCLLALVLALIFRSIGGEYARYLVWACIAVAVLSLVSRFTKYFLSQFVVTNQRVIIRHGLLARTTYEMILQKIESISVNQSLADRFIWGSGTLIITGTGGTKEVFPHVGRAVAFQDHLNEAMQPSREPDGAGSAGGRARSGGSSGGSATSQRQGGR
jgi:uncharacterized membrane protein YdbT with pleckstrin-like domain